MIDYKLWLPENEIDELAWTQISAAISHPYATEHMAIMPDCHGGYGVPIGSVLKTKDAIIPSAVGVDIGCGILLEHITDIFVEDEREWYAFAQALREAVPTGNKIVGSNKSYPANNSHFFSYDFSTVEDFLKETPHAIEMAGSQIGTLGGGNHFMEVVIDKDNGVYFMVHSGSRGIGAKIANYFEKRTVIESGIPKDLGILKKNSPNYTQYVRLMQKCETYAKRNRGMILSRMREAYVKTIGKFSTSKDRSFKKIDCTHNIAIESMGTWLHRKGATSAKENELGVIPGSMGSKSYAVKGKGNKESHESSSHGSGRVLGRSAAKRTLSIEEFRESLKGTYTVARESNLDEAPRAYKDISQVMERQKDLVDIVLELSPVITIKG